jgi:two-component system NarL family sensor kinase
VYAYNLGHHRLPFAAAAVLVEPSWIPAVALIPLVILLFPDGRLSSSRWRLVLWVYAALWTCVLAAIWVPTVTAVADHDVRLDSFGDVEGSGGQAGAAISALELLIVAAIVVIWLSFVAHQVLSWRRAAGERRQQQKWLASGAAITMVGFALGAAFSGGIVGTWPGSESPPCPSASVSES